VGRKKALVLKSAARPEERVSLEKLFKVLSSRYLLYITHTDIIRHIALFHRTGEAVFDWEIGNRDDPQVRTVTLCAKDRPGLFSKIAGVLTLNGFDILDAKIFTWRNATALDIFHVKAPIDRLREDQKWARTRMDLEAALLDKLDLGAALREKLEIYDMSKPHAATRPPRVVVDNHSSSFYTIVEVFCYDFPGMLFLLTDALFRCGLDIWVAKISTKVAQVVDVFYVRDINGNKADSLHQVADIQTTLAEVLESGYVKQD
jgi:[protein-PII] uridylyltransferase